MSSAVSAHQLELLESGNAPPFEYQSAPIDNPLKGLVPYADPDADRFPHSLEFSYLKFSKLVVGEKQYDFEPLEKLLKGIESRGNQAVIRVYLEYPGKKNCIPKYLIEQGLKVTKYSNTNTQPDEPKRVATPDYENPLLRNALVNFVRELGKRYDGDPRLGYITAGLLGTWGEWHNYPRTELWASHDVQNEVMSAYEKAFKKTPVLLRYPAGLEDELYVRNVHRKFGYHDDSFAWATLDTGLEEDDWFFQARLKATKATQKWKSYPIGGEIRPEVWGCCFDTPPCTPEGQEFAKCRDALHVTWLMDSGMFEQQADKVRLAQAKQQVARMGYEFQVVGASIKRDSMEQNQLEINVQIKNTGIAPFYHSGWLIHVGAMSTTGDFGSSQSDRELTGILPGETKVLSLNFESDPAWTLANLMISVPNRMDGGKPIRFANKTQDQHRKNWLTIWTWRQDAAQRE